MLHGLRNKLYISLKWLHRLVPCSPADLLLRYSLLRNPWVERNKDVILHHAAVEVKQQHDIEGKMGQ